MTQKSFIRSGWTLTASFPEPRLTVFQLSYRSNYRSSQYSLCTYYRPLNWFFLANIAVSAMCESILQDSIKITIIITIQNKNLLIQKALEMSLYYYNHYIIIFRMDLIITRLLSERVNPSVGAVPPRVAGPGLQDSLNGVYISSGGFFPAVNLIGPTSPALIVSRIYLPKTIWTSQVHIPR